MLELSLQEIQEKHPLDIIILGGDFNAAIAEFDDDLEPEVTQGSKLVEHRQTLIKKTDWRGEFLMNFMLENEFVLLNGRTKSDSPGRYTNSSATATWDLVWVNSDKVGHVEDLENCHPRSLT